jgi:hypothetical protein
MIFHHLLLRACQLHTCGRQVHTFDYVVGDPAGRRSWMLVPEHVPYCMLCMKTNVQEGFFAKTRRRMALPLALTAG